MPTITITVDRAEALAKLRQFLPQQLGTLIAMGVATDRLIPALSPYPAPRRKKMEFVSAKQRRFVMAAIREGRIQVPYPRTYNLLNGWSATAQPPFNAIVRNAMPYAKYVVGIDDQANYHKDWWVTIGQTAAEVEQNTAEDAAAAIISREIVRIGLS